MAVTHASSVRDSIATVIKNALEAGAGSAVMVVRTSGGTILAVVDLGETVGTVNNGILTYANLPSSDNSIDATGTAAIVHFIDSDSNLVYSGTITQSGGGGDVTLASSDPAALNFVAGNIFTLQSGSYTAPV